MKSGPPLLKASYTSIEAARALRLSVRTIQLMLDRGDLQGWKTPRGHRRIFIDSVEYWRATRQARPPAPPPSQGGVLVIEDSSDRRSLILELLHEQDPEADIHLAGDIIVGLTMYGRLQPRLLIVGLPIPGIDSAVLLSRLRGHRYFGESQRLIIMDARERARCPDTSELEVALVIDSGRLRQDLAPRLRQCLAASGQAEGSPAIATTDVAAHLNGSAA